MKGRKIVSIKEKEIQIYLFGSLLKQSAKKNNQEIKLIIGSPSPLTRVLDLLEIPDNKVHIAFVNHRAVKKNHLVKPGDRVCIFPNEYAFFADWNTFRI